MTLVAFVLLACQLTMLGIICYEQGLRGDEKICWTEKYVVNSYPILFTAAYI